MLGTKLDIRQSLIWGLQWDVRNPAGLWSFSLVPWRPLFLCPLVGQKDALVQSYISLSSIQRNRKLFFSPLRFHLSLSSSVFSVKQRPHSVRCHRGRQQGLMVRLEFSSKTLTGPQGGRGCCQHQREWMPVTNRTAAFSSYRHTVFNTDSQPFASF